MVTLCPAMGVRLSALIVTDCAGLLTALTVKERAALITLNDQLKRRVSGTLQRRSLHELLQLTVPPNNHVIITYFVKNVNK